MKYILGYEKAIPGKFYIFTCSFDVYACQPFVGILKPQQLPADKIWHQHLKIMNNFEQSKNGLLNHQIENMYRLSTAQW